MHEGGGNCLIYLKSGWNRKEKRGHKNFKKGGKLGQGVGALKRGAGTLLMNYGGGSYYKLTAIDHNKFWNKFFKRCFA